MFTYHAARGKKKRDRQSIFRSNSRQKTEKRKCGKREETRGKDVGGIHASPLLIDVAIVGNQPRARSRGCWARTYLRSHVDGVVRKEARKNEARKRKKMKIIREVV